MVEWGFFTIFEKLSDLVPSPHHQPNLAFPSNNKLIEI